MSLKVTSWACVCLAGLCLGACPNQDIRPTTSAPVVSQQGVVPVSLSANELALVNRVSELNARLVSMEARIGSIGQVNLVNIGGGGLTGLVLYFVVRYFGLRPSSPTERKLAKGCDPWLDGENGNASVDH